MQEIDFEISINKSKENRESILLKEKRIYSVLKRIMDIVFSSLLLIFLSPIIILVSIIIKITSDGPIIFKQLRVGYKNELFYIYKFRSMHTNSPNVATRELDDCDVYVTSIGKIIRKTSIDELPQLINILKGEMSFIGPRPLIVEETDIHRLRNEVGVYDIKPGLTGWAQVNGRDNVNLYEKAQLDKFYVDNRGFILDLKIIILTIAKVFKSEGVVDGQIDTNLKING